MITLRTSRDTVLPIEWIGISDFDGSLRFETTETDLPRLFAIFNDPEETGTLTRVYDEDEKTYTGFTAFKGIERMASGNTVVRLMKGEQ